MARQMEHQRLLDLSAQGEEDAAAKAEAEGIDGGVLLSTDGRCVALNQLGLTKEASMKLNSAIEELRKLEASCAN